ncbi:MAG: peptidoglycan-binding domain-containing protein [Patescibacteria group bacterium]
MTKRCAITAVSILCAPVLVFASFDRNLYFGMTNDPDVRTLQEFLQEQMVYEGPVTGNFLTLTRDGVRRFQEREEITPASGYFGPVTRAHTNALMHENGEVLVDAQAEERVATIAFLRGRIAELERQIVELRVRIEQETAAAPTEAVSPPVQTPESIGTTTAEITPTEKATSTTASAARFDGMTLGGTATMQFPAATGPFKVGDITLTNGTARPVLLSQIRTTVNDTMNSTRNRGRKTFFTVRDGTQDSDVMISRNAYTFNSNAPIYGPNVGELNISYPVSFTAGETRTSGVWLEDFEYVESGTLEIVFSSFSASDAVAASGTFRFILTRQ